MNIVQNGKSLYHIVAGVSADAAVRHAASQLQKYIYQSTGACIPYFGDGCRHRGPEILVGFEARDSAERANVNELGNEGYRIKTDDEDLIITGKTPRGVLYGVYEFLNRFVGFRCFAAGIEKVDIMRSLIIPELDITGEPAFEYREVYFRKSFDGDYCVKNRLNSNMADLSAEKGGQKKFYNFHHSFKELIPPEVYYESHPEYFSEIDSKRIKEHSQPCLSNAEVLNIAIKKVRQWIADNPHCHVFSVAQNDWNNYCTCQKCRETDEYEGSPSGNIIRFANKIAENLENDYPDILLHTFAYTYSRKAPLHVKPHKNLIVRLCSAECDWSKSFEELAAEQPDGAVARFLYDLKHWAEITDRLYIWDYAVNFNNYLQPFPNMRNMAKNIRLFQRYSVRGILEQGNFSYGGGAALDELKSYVAANVMNDPSKDTDVLIDEFLQGYYGKSATFIAEYIQLMEKAAAGTSLSIYQGPDSPMFTDQLIEKAGKIFEQAIKAADTEQTRYNTEKDALSIEYMRLTRMDINAENRNDEIDKFAEKLRRFGITEIMERTALDLSIGYMKSNRFAKNRAGYYSTYYIMK